MTSPGGLGVVRPGSVGGAAKAAESGAVRFNRAFDDARDKAARQTDTVRIDVAGLDNFVDLDDSDAGGLGKARVEVLGAAAEFAIAQAVGAVRRHKCVVDFD